MASVEDYSATGDAYTDGLLMGAKWSSGDLTYSFVQTAASLGGGYGYGETAAGFRSLASTQQAAVRNVLAQYSTVADLHFTETAGAAGDLRYGATAATKTAWAYNPHASAEGGDVWISSTGGLFNKTAVGGYADLTLLHETGHALGLKHVDEADGAFGVLPADHDSLEYTVMSYKSFAGATEAGGYKNGTWDYPQTLMLDDIRAIQHLYGAQFDQVGKAAVYRWNDKTGELSINDVGQGKPGGDRVFMTVWTGGAEVTYDFSNYATDLDVDLRPGEWSTISADQLARLDVHGDLARRAAGNIANAYLVQKNGHDNLVANAVGGAGADHILGNQADNRLTGGAGNDALDGGDGLDTAVYAGASADYGWSLDADGAWTIADHREGGPDGIDVLANIERLAFSDGVVALEPAPIVFHVEAMVAFDLPAPEIVLVGVADGAFSLF